MSPEPLPVDRARLVWGKTNVDRPWRGIPVSDRFWSRVSEDSSGCWLWTGARHVKGYGFFVVNRKQVRVHRFAYEDLRADIPEGLVIDHLCRNRLCVNPWHLEPVTVAVNTARGSATDALRRHYAKQTHCKSGHPLWGENLRITPDGYRACRACHRAWAKSAVERRREREAS